MTSQQLHTIERVIFLLGDITTLSEQPSEETVDRCKQLQRELLDLLTTQQAQ